MDIKQRRIAYNISIKRKDKVEIGTIYSDSPYTQKQVDELALKFATDIMLQKVGEIEICTPDEIADSTIVGRCPEAKDEYAKALVKEAQEELKKGG